MSDGTPRATDVERMIHMFLHDVRSPLGVAQGYTHLLGGQQLSADDRGRALLGVNDALVRLAYLVDGVATWLGPAAPLDTQGVAEASLVCDGLKRAVDHVVDHDVRDHARLRVGHSLDVFVDAVQVIFNLTDPSRKRGTREGTTLVVSSDDAVLRLQATAGDAHDEGAVPDNLVPCDPWTVERLDYLVAHQRLAQLGGIIWCRQGESRATSVTLPLEL